MQKRQLGKTGLAVTAIGYGAIKLPRISEEEAAACLNRALDLGINYVDTARNYRDSEAKIGLGIGHRRDEFYIATKTGARGYDGAMADLETSLRELRMDTVDIWQLHTVSSEEAWQAVMGPQGALKAARRAREEGVVKHVSITIHRALDVMRKAINSGEFETIMVCYSPMDSERVADILPLAREKGMGTIIMKALSGGQISYPKEARQAGLGGPDALVAGTLRWVLTDENVDCVIPGMQAVHEVDENCALIDPFVPLSDEEYDELIRRLGEFGGEYRYEQRCLQCGYCQPCPEGVNIPAIFQAAGIVRNYPDDLKHMGHELYGGLEVTIEACVECGTCVEKCPAGLPIPEMLRETRELLEAH